MNSKILEFENVNFKYDKALVLNDVNFSLEKGDFLGIIGENGTGKTTLMKLILGFLHPDSGRISLFGTDRRKFKSDELLGYVSQKANSFVSDFPATVFEVASLGLYAKRGFLNFPKKEDKALVMHALEEVGMADFHDRLIGRLSGGQQQRVFIARALIKNPEIMILDEPTVGIDAKSVCEISELLADLNKKGMTVIMTNHDTHALKRDANKILTLYADATASITKTDSFETVKEV